VEVAAGVFPGGAEAWPHMTVAERVASLEAYAQDEIERALDLGK
jgi:hypothetical protein